MRTTIVIDDDFDLKLKPIVSKRKLSEFVNACLREHFERKEKEARLKKLEDAYQRASHKKNVIKEFEALDIEEWPEW